MVKPTMSTRSGQLQQVRLEVVSSSLANLVLVQPSKDRPCTKFQFPFAVNTPFPNEKSMSESNESSHLGRILLFTTLPVAASGAVFLDVMTSADPEPWRVAAATGGFAVFLVMAVVALAIHVYTRP